MRRSILQSTWGLFVGLVLVMVAAGIYTTLLGVRAELAGLPTIVSGGISTAYYVGFMLGSWYTLRVLTQVGHIRAFAALAALLSSVVIMMGITDYPIVWFAMRLITGFCYAGMYVVAESWLHGLAKNTFRGRLLAIYSAVVIGGFGLGQLLVFGIDAQALTGFAIAAAVISLAVIPISISEQATTPKIENPIPLSMKELARTVPTGMGTTVLVGIAHGGLLGLAAIYATREGLSIGRVGLFLAAIQFGGMVMSWPISSASDDIDRRVVGVIASLGTMGAAALLFLQPVTSPWAIVIMFVIGGFSSPLYALAGSYTNDWISEEHLNAAASKLVTLYGIGAMMGPLIASLFMEFLDSEGYIWSIIAMHGAIVLFLVYRIRAWHAPLTTKPWTEVSVPARAFFIPATMVAFGTKRRRSAKNDDSVPV
jgi:MFS family permease